jgi:hypothetical protein
MTLAIASGRNERRLCDGPRAVVARGIPARFRTPRVTGEAVLDRHFGAMAPCRCARAFGDTSRRSRRARIRGSAFAVKLRYGHLSVATELIGLIAWSIEECDSSHPRAMWGVAIRISMVVRRSLWPSRTYRGAVSRSASSRARRNVVAR